MKKLLCSLLQFDTGWYLLLLTIMAVGPEVRRAVDEYLARLPKIYFLHRVDYTYRSFVK